MTGFSHTPSVLSLPFRNSGLGGNGKRGKRSLLIPALALLLISVASAQEPPPAAISIFEAQTLASQEPFKETEIRVRGVVTWVDPSAGKTFYIQDEKEGIPVETNGETFPALSDEIEVTGKISRGVFTPLITRASFRKTGVGTLPPPFNASAGGLLNGAFNGKRVRITGAVRSLEMISPDRASIVIDSGAARLVLLVSNFKKDNIPAHFIGGRFVAIGVATPTKARGDIRQLINVGLLIANTSDIELYPPSIRLNADFPLVPLDETYRYHPAFDRAQPKRTTGKIIHRASGITYLADGRSGLMVRAGGSQKSNVGDWVEATGFVDIESHFPVLSEAVLTPSPAKTVIRPKKSSAQTLLSGDEHSNYVSLTGRLLESLRIPGHAGSETHETIHVFSLGTPRGVFTAELNASPDQQLPGNLRVGALVRISGICLNETDTLGNPTGFRILVPSANDILVVEPAGFFTTRRLLILLSLLLAILLAFISTSLYYFRKNSILLTEMRERKAITNERNRLARDLHDTLEQGLTAIQLRLYGIEPGQPSIDQDLTAARTLVQQCHAEMRQSIWNLRAPSGNQTLITEELERKARSLILAQPIELEIIHPKYPLALPLKIRDNLLHIGQEAISNAIRHAHPGRITIEMNISPGNVTLLVSDNGRGMSKNTEKPGHFGLIGMKERAARIGGTLRITSSPENGTSIRVDIPLPLAS